MREEKFLLLGIGAMRNSLAMATLFLSLVVGCVPNSRHDSHVDDRFVWVEKGIAYEDVLIDLGYRVEFVDGAQWLEPGAMITRDGVPVANALVFNSLASADGSDLIAEEIATEYDLSLDSDVARYVRGKLQLPIGTSRCVVRFRIVLPNSRQQWTRDLTIQVK